MADTKVFFRNATLDDLPEILRVEESWPEEGRAGADKFISRIERFGQGFLLPHFIDPEGKELIVATISSMPMHYAPEQVTEIQSWNQVTNGGYLHDAAPANWNALYIVSGVIGYQYRGSNIFAPSVLRIVELAHALGKRFVLAGAVIPGYRKFCEKNGGMPAFEYCRTRRGNHLVDPLLAMYEGIGFSVPDARHVIPEYYPDDASKNYAAIVVRDLERKPLLNP